ncbi:MAG: sulfatase-like hydrolase/transferase [Planctomycetaceae bacterium]|nr:sulfatase-like hydrolase/transferase [Planctomycetaceae bacterium]
MPAPTSCSSDLIAIDSPSPRRRTVFRWLLSACCLLITVSATSASVRPANNRRPPNIILVMADDQGWGDTHYNGHPFVRTPALDAMAAEAFVFDRFYAAAPVCSPTRASVMTGRHPIRTKVTNHGRYMRPHEQTIAETLRAAGYVTGMFGKVHLGSGQPDSPCNPGGMGFDEWVIGLNFYDNDPYLSRNGTIEHRKGKGSVLAMDDAIDFLRRHKEGEQPVFAVVWFPSPHDPHQEVPEGPSLYDGEKQAGYYREITLLDEQMGRLRRTLKDLEIAENTILWYCSDNGGLNEATSGGRKKKGSIYEGGLRVPSVIEWPAGQLHGRTSVPAWTCDILPTVLALANVKTKLPHSLDGTDISPIITGQADQRSRPMGFWHNLQPGQATWSDRIQKAILEKQQTDAPLPHNAQRMAKDVDEFPQFPETTAKGHAAWTDWPWKLHRINGSEYELYHLVDDPMESRNLAASPEQQRRVTIMKRQLDKWMRSVIRSLNGADYDGADYDGARVQR